MSRRVRAALAAAALAAVTGQILVTYLPGWRPPLIGTITVSAVGLSFLAAGIAAWVRWPASRLGLLFTLAGYLWLLPGVARLPYPLPFTLGNPSQLFMSPKTVETHVGSIFGKLGLAPDAGDHRRVLAVLAFLRQ